MWQGSQDPEVWLIRPPNIHQPFPGKMPTKLKNRKWKKKVTESDASKWCSFFDLLEPHQIEDQKKVHNILQNSVKYTKAFWDNTQHALELLGSHCMCREGTNLNHYWSSFSFVLLWNFNRFLKIYLHHHSGSSQNPAELHPFF